MLLDAGPSYQDRPRPNYRNSVGLYLPPTNAAQIL